MKSLKNFDARMLLVVLALVVLLNNPRLVLAADDKKTATLPEVVVTGEANKKSYKSEKLSSSKYTEPLRDVPQSVTVVPQAVIQEQGATSLREVLRNVPGISIQAGEGGVPAGDNLTIRGFNARTDMFIDGVRDFGGYSRDSFNFEQIEVVKGPASAYAGRGSTGGSVNQASKSPKEKAFYRGSMGFGLLDEYQRYTVDVNQPLETIGQEGAAFRFNAVWHDADITGRDFVENQRFGVAPSLEFGMNGPTQLILSYFHMAQDNVPDYGLPFVPTNHFINPAGVAGQPAPVDFDNYYGLLTRDFEKTATDIGTVELKHEVSDDLTLRNLTRYGVADRDSLITSPRFVSATSQSINREFQSRDMVDTILTNLTDMVSKFKTGFIEHALVTGVELTRETSINRLRTGPTTPVTTLFDPDPFKPYNSDGITTTGAENEAWADSFAIYGFDTAKLNEKWELIGGLRYDYSDVAFRAKPISAAVPDDLTRNDGLLSWRAGVVYKPQPNGSVYTAYGTSFNPSYEGLSLSGNSTNAANVNTDAEKSETYEIGTKWDVFDEKMSLSAAVFRTLKTNARTEDPANTGDFVVLQGEQRVDGFELGASGNINEAWAVFGAYTFLDSKVTRSLNPLEEGNMLSNTPHNTLSLWTTYDLTKQWQFGAGAQFVDDRFNSNIVNNAANSRKQAPDYWLFDAMAAYKINDNITLRFNLYNLADKDYIDRLSGGHFVPGAGRSATLTTEFAF